MKTSPWDDDVSKESPNGELVAVIEDAHEIGMGAPTWGDLKISNGMKIEGCNPSIVWSEDSRFLAVPKWTRDKNQRLIVIDVEREKIYPFSGEYAVLELDRFENGTISGVDSPIYRSQNFTRSIEELNIL